MMHAKASPVCGRIAIVTHNSILFLFSSFCYCFFYTLYSYQYHACEWIILHIEWNEMKKKEEVFTTHNLPTLNPLYMNIIIIT